MSSKLPEARRVEDAVGEHAREQLLERRPLRGGEVGRRQIDLAGSSDIDRAPSVLWSRHRFVSLSTILAPLHTLDGVTDTAEPTYPGPRRRGGRRGRAPRRPLQIIAAAGSGKTEVVSQRVASLLADGEPPESIVAFTFTEKAAEELKERIRQRVTARVGASATDQLGRLFVGTIHGYCFRLLQTHVPRYETYTPLDENQLVNLLYREAKPARAQAVRPSGKLFKGIEHVPAQRRRRRERAASTRTRSRSTTFQRRARAVLRDARRLPVHVVRHADRPRRRRARRTRPSTRRSRPSSAT